MFVKIESMVLSLKELKVKAFINIHTLEVCRRGKISGGLRDVVLVNLLLLGSLSLY